MISQISKQKSWYLFFLDINTQTKMIRNRIYKLIAAHDMLCDTTKTLDEFYGYINAVSYLSTLK